MRSFLGSGHRQSGEKILTFSLLRRTSVKTGVAKIGRSLAAYPGRVSPIRSHPWQRQTEFKLNFQLD